MIVAARMELEYEDSNPLPLRLFKLKMILGKPRPSIGSDLPATTKAIQKKGTTHERKSGTALPQTLQIKLLSSRHPWTVNYMPLERSWSLVFYIKNGS